MQFKVADKACGNSSWFVCKEELFLDGWSSPMSDFLQFEEMLEMNAWMLEILDNV